jgi:Domain of unknown function (DUF3883)
MGLGDIRREDVLGAIALLDDPVEGPRLLDELHLRRAKDYRLVYEGRFYDSKAVVGIAHGLGAGGKYLTSGDFSGGLESVVRVLSRLGFYVDAGFLYDITQLRVDRTHGRPAPYQYIVLLWAIARARSGPPRLVPFNDARDELAQILAPFAVAQTAPDPAMPWRALDGSILWELEKPLGATSVSESDVKSLNLAAGLSVSVYNRVAQENSYKGFVEAAIDVIAVRVGNEPGFQPLLEQLGFADLGSISGGLESPEVADAIAAVESVSNPRRKFGRRLTAVENAAIEERAVLVTRGHFENELGYETEDVGAYVSYDVRASKGQEVVKVEVKGTTTDGAEVVLTKNEVNLHRVEYPNNALAVVHNITLDRSGDQPIASGGELVLVMPWKIEEGGLIPIAYDYRTGI